MESNRKNSTSKHNIQKHVACFYFKCQKYHFCLDLVVLRIYKTFSDYKNALHKLNKNTDKSPEKNYTFITLTKDELYSYWIKKLEKKLIISPSLNQKYTDHLQKEYVVKQNGFSDKIKSLKRG